MTHLYEVSFLFWSIDHMSEIQPSVSEIPCILYNYFKNGSVILMFYIFSVWYNRYLCFMFLCLQHCGFFYPFNRVMLSSRQYVCCTTYSIIINCMVRSFLWYPSPQWHPGKGSFLSGHQKWT